MPPATAAADTPRRRRRHRHICLLGLSADPPTGDGGHVGLARALVRHFRATAADDATAAVELRVLPVYRHTYAAKRARLRPFAQRLAMCRLAFAGVAAEAEADAASEAEASSSAATAVVPVTVAVSAAERDAFDWALRRRAGAADTDPAPPGDAAAAAAAASFGTATLLEYLRATEPPGDSSYSYTYSLALGADAFCDLAEGRWRESPRVLRLVDRILVVERPAAGAGAGDGASGAIGDATDATAARLRDALARCEGCATLLVAGALRDVSSSQARACSDPDRLRELVPGPVADYIQEHRLYAFADGDTDAPS